MEDPFDAIERMHANRGSVYDLNHEGPVYARVVSVSEVDGFYGPYPVVKGVTRDDTYITFEGKRSVLADELRKVSPGDYISVEWLGALPKKRSPGETYNGYAVTILTLPSAPVAAPAPARWAKGPVTGEEPF